MKLFPCLSRLHAFFLDLLFPIYCLGCKKPNVWLCDNCLAKINLRQEHVCPVCEKNPTPDGHTCFACKEKSSLSALLPASSYQNELLVKAVHFYKYRFIADLSLPLGQLLTKAFVFSSLSLPDLILPVPLHKRRLRWRGFNQAIKLAEFISQNALPLDEIPLAQNVLVREKYTQPQMKIRSWRERKQNMLDAFAVKNKTQIQNKTILLIDDVATTGATLFACAEALKKNGAREVFALVLARQEIKTKNISNKETTSTY